ncbi:hypothetical protein D9M73_169730 [compost metagenome]
MAPSPQDDNCLDHHCRRSSHSAKHGRLPGYRYPGSNPSRESSDWGALRGVHFPVTVQTDDAKAGMRDLDGRGFGTANHAVQRVKTTGSWLRDAIERICRIFLASSVRSKHW